MYTRYRQIEMIRRAFYSLSMTYKLTNISLRGDSLYQRTTSRLHMFSGRNQFLTQFFNRRDSRCLHQLDCAAAAAASFA